MHCRGKSLESASWGAETEVAGNPRTLAVGSGFRDTRTMKHSGGTMRSRNNPGLLYRQLRGRSRGFVKLYLLEDAGYVAGVPSFETDSGGCSIPVQHSETCLTPPPGGRPRHPLDRLGKCDWSGGEKVETL